VAGTIGAVTAPSRSELARLDRRLAWQSPAVGAALGLGLLAAPLASWTVVALVVIGQALTISGIHRGLHVTAPVSGMTVSGVVAVVADVAVLRSTDYTLAPVVTVVGLGFLLAIVQQLARRDDRDGLLASMAATVTVSAIAAFASAWEVVWLGEGRVVLQVAATALVLSSLARLVPSAAWAPVVVLVAAVGAGALVGVGLGCQAGHSALLGLAVGVGVGLVDGVVRRARVSLRLRWWATGALSFAAAAPLAYLATHLT
jgi:hypothetical protein